MALLLLLSVVCCAGCLLLTLSQSTMPRTFSDAEIREALVECDRENDRLVEENKTLKTSVATLHGLIRGIDEANKSLRTDVAGQKRRIADLEEERSRKMAIIRDQTLEVMDPATATAFDFGAPVVAAPLVAAVSAPVVAAPVVSAPVARRRIGALHASGAMGRHRDAKKEDSDSSSEDEIVICDSSYDE